MIPPILATTGAKIAASLGLVVVLTGIYFGWREYQQRVGYAEAEAEHLRDAMAQQQESIGHFIVREKLKLLTVERTARQKDRVNAELRNSYQDVIALVAERELQPTREADYGRPNDDDTATAVQDCVLDPAVVRAVNGMARVLDAATEDGAAAPGGSTGEPAL